MADTLAVLHIIGIVAFFIFVVLGVFVLIGRAKIKHQLKQSGYQQFEEIFVQSISDASFSKVLKEIRFFLGKRKDVNLTHMHKQLKHQRLLEISTAIIFVISYASITGSLVLN